MTLKESYDRMNVINEAMAGEPVQPGDKPELALAQEFHNKMLAKWGIEHDDLADTRMEAVREGMALVQVTIDQGEDPSAGLMAAIGTVFEMGLFTGIVQGGTDPGDDSE